MSAADLVAAIEEALGLLDEGDADGAAVVLQDALDAFGEEAQTEQQAGESLVSLLREARARLDAPERRVGHIRPGARTEPDPRPTPSESWPAVLARMVNDV
jgi:hypothetical protein